MTSWFGFFLSLTIILVLARKNLWLALIIGAYVLGSFSLGFFELLSQTWATVSDIPIFLLALSVGLIPIIGGAMEQGGLMQMLVTNLPFKRRTKMAFSSAFVGLLPIPGGALLSAPLIERSGPDVKNEDKTAINVWFRHVLLLIYPLGALLATTKMAQISLYTAMLYLFPGFVLMMLMGWFFLLRHVENEKSGNGAIDSRKILKPALVFLAAPVIHFVLMNLFKNIVPEIFLLIGVLVSISMAFYFGRIPVRDIRKIAVKMKFWNFALIILGMFIFLNIFQASETSNVIAEAGFSKPFLIVGMGSILGFATGRVQVPISILMPIYIAQFGSDAVTPLVFAILFFAVYQGYLVSPVHPCVLVTMTYFKTDLKEMYRRLALPAFISVILAALLAVCLL